VGETLDIEQVLACAVSAAAAAGNAIARHRAAGNAGIHFKDSVEPVSSADLLSDRVIASAIGSAFPGHRLLSEERVDGDLADFDFSGPLWVVDPIDGTANYLHGHPHVAVSIAFARDGVVQAGVVHAPFMQETFTAVRGEGAFLNGERIRVAEPESLARSIISTGFPHLRTDVSSLVERVRKLLEGCADIRRSAAPALDIAWVAAGRLDAHTETLFPWDVAAATLIAREAGASRSHLGEVPSNMPADLCGDDIIVSAPAIHQDLVALLCGP
jgi:myo-inositol-1(or 4)-monophosphatase